MSVPAVELRHPCAIGCLVAAVAFGMVDVAAAAAAPGSPRFTRLSVEDGLSQSSVEHILQDRRGLLWFGTQEGLNRYDGYRFTIHRAREQAGFLHDHDIQALIEDARGDLWVGTSRGLYRYGLDTGRFDECAAPADGLSILELIQGGGGRIFFTAADGRLWVLDPADPERRAHSLSDGPFAALRGVTALAPGPGSSIWAAAGGRLFRVDDVAGGARLTEASAAVGTVSVMAADRQDDLWIGGPDGDLLRYRPADGRIDRFPQVPRHQLAILPEKDGEVWIGARGGGLTRLDPKTGDVVVYRHDPEDPASLSGDDIAAIYQDASGGLWVGTWNGGVNRFDPHAQAFRTFRRQARTPDSLPADDVTAMTELPDGSLWLASRSGIVAAGDPRSGRFRTAAVFAGRGRWTALASWEARVLVGTSRGLIVLEAPSGREVPLDAALRVLGDLPIAAIRGTPGAAWIATGRELFRVVRSGARGALDVTRLDVPIEGLVSTLSAPGDGRLWIGSDRGEIVRAQWGGADGAVVMHALDAAGPPADSFAAHGVVSALFEDRQGRLWVGTRRGLGRFEPASATVSWLGQRDGLPSTNIAGLERGGDGHLWIAHNRGLTRMNPETGGMTQFGERDGAQGKGYAEGASAAGASGLLYFAGEGVTAFDPREVSVSPDRPRVAFTALEILHRTVVPRWLDPASPLERTLNAQSEVTLNPDATVFSVEMAPLHYADPPGNRLLYRLEGFDTEWIETDAHNRVATYTNLAPGHYVLHARAGTRNGVWSEGEATLAIHLLPPWWRTRAALAVWVLLALGAAGLAWAAVGRWARVRLALLERETLRRDSLTDALTGLHNRRFLASWLEQEVPKLLREYRLDGPDSGAGLVLLLIDVDYFKSINDLHSHAAGDRVLCRIAAALREHTRGSDLVVRWGGDEFLVVSRSVQRGHATEAAERLRAAVAALESGDDGAPAPTVSIGFAPFPFLPDDPGALSWEQALDLADHALRLTKRRRRNSYTGLRATPGLTAASVLQFLAGGGAELPASVEVVMSGDGGERMPAPAGSGAAVGR